MRQVLAAVIAALTCVASGSVLADDALFVRELSMEHAGLSEKWRSAQRRISEDEAQLVTCRIDAMTCSEGAHRLNAIVASGRVREGRARIGVVNRAVNLAIRPVSDERRFGVADRWSGPLETISAGEGDCEDYAILKLLALQEAGVARDDLGLLIVKDRVTGSDHALAAARLEGRWLLLDNRSFALVDLEQTPYRVLAHLAPDADGRLYARLDATRDAARDATYGEGEAGLSAGVM
jgi:predicted transglutaminase-like cysteine proteinase